MEYLLVIIVGIVIITIIRLNRAARSIDNRNAEVEAAIIADKEWVDFLNATGTKHGNAHLDTLIRKRSQLVVTDDYGMEDKSRWCKELRHFVERVIMPDVEDYIVRTSYDNHPTFEEISDLLVETTDKAIDNFMEAEKESDSYEHDDYDESMTPYEYEHYCARLLRNAGWDAKVTQSSGDQGVDIVAEKEGARIAIQCKQFSKPAGNKAVQEIRAGVEFIDADCGAVVATSGYTRSARELANKTGIRLLHHTDLKYM